MKPNKIKRYRMPVSRTFPVKHPRAGERTMLVCKILHALNLPVASETMHFRCGNDCNSTCERMLLTPKLHTIRANYNLWAKRMAEVQAGRAVIELCYWSEKPYRSKQVVFATLDKNSGCGVQKLEFSASGLIGMIKIDDDFQDTSIADIAKNDGLSLKDFKEWFKGADFSQPMAIIQFTGFRY